MPLLRALRNWTGFVSRTVGFGFTSCAVGWLPAGQRVSRWCMHRWCVTTSDALGIRRQLIGAELLERAPQCVFVSNHQSLLDILVLGSFLTRDYRWLAKHSLFKIPFLGWHLSLSGHIPVQRGKDRSNRDLPERIHAVVAEGASLLFFPEGTRSEDGRLRRFHLGAFNAAVQEGLPVVPLLLEGTGGLLQKGTLDLAVAADRNCTVTVLPPVPLPPEGEPRARAEALRDQVEAIYRERLGLSAPARDAASRSRPASRRSADAGAAAP